MCATMQTGSAVRPERGWTESSYLIELPKSLKKLNEFSDKTPKSIDYSTVPVIRLKLDTLTITNKQPQH